MTEDLRNRILSGIDLMVDQNDEDMVSIYEFQGQIKDLIKTIEARSKMIHDGIDQIKAEAAVDSN